MADLTSEAKVPLLPLNSTPQYTLLRHTPTCMVHVCNAIDGRGLCREPSGRPEDG